MESRTERHPVKILIVQESDWLSKGPHQQHHLADRLSLRGHQIRVIDYEILWREQDKKKAYSNRQVFDNVSKINPAAKVTVIRPGMVRMTGIEYISLVFTHRKEIRRQIREFAPDVIVGFGILNAYLALGAARKNSIPFIYYWIDVLHLLIPFKVFHFIGVMLENIVLKGADMVLTINDKLRDYVIKAGASPDKTLVLRAGIDIEQFSPKGNDNSKNIIRKQYGLKEDDVVLFFMGWLYHFSGLKEVAQQLVKTNDHRLKLLIVGEGDAYDELRQIQERYSLNDRLILTGKKPYQDIPAFIAASDVCLLPAYPNKRIMQDIVPIKMYEYMAMGKPVISTELPGVVREFGEGNGVVYVSKPEDVVGKAIELFQAGNLEELGTKGRSFVERYSWDNITDEFERTLEKVIKEKKK
jgi:glycosyltransferase involved in cell wall biosynthesis